MVLREFALTDKVSIVTGSGKGIGKAIALGFADAGSHVVVVARTTADIEATAAEIRAKGRKALAVPTDVQYSDQVNNLVQNALNEFGRIDILVNNVGGVFRAQALKMSENAWDAIVRNNLKSVFLCSKAAGEVMAKQESGNIINISSLASLGPSPNRSHYAAAKAGVNSLTQTLAVEWAPFHIRVNCIVVGSVETPAIAPFYEQHPEERESRRQKIPLGRHGVPEDIVGAAVFLASDASRYITGVLLPVSGGLLSPPDLGPEGSFSRQY